MFKAQLQEAASPAWRFASGVTLLLGVALACPAGATEPTDGNAEDGIALEDITITSRHREEKLQDVPIAVTAVTERQLAATGLVTIRQIQSLVPSLQILGFNPRNITIQIRGLGTTAGTVNSGIEPGVGVYVNGVYYARPSIAVFDLVDIERVDVLRGPQDTLFGKNTTAGVIDIVTKRPSDEPELSLEASYGDYGYKQEKLVASTPLGKSGFAARLAAVNTDRNGTIYNTTFQNDWNDYHNRGVRGELDYRNSEETFLGRFLADYNDQQQYSGFFITRGVLPKLRDDGSVGWTGGRGFYDRAASIGYTPLPIDPGARLTDMNTPFTVNMQTGGTSLQLDQKLFANHTLTSVTGYRFWDWNPSLDGDRIGAAINTRSNLPTHQRQFSQELRFASASGQTVEYTTGLYYFWQRNKEIPFNTYGEDAAQWILGTAYPSQALDGLTQTGLQLARTQSYSAFANATWHAADKFTVSGGLRYTYETRTGDYNSIRTGEVPLTDPVFASLTAAQIAAIVARRETFAPIANAGIPYTAKASGGEVSGTTNVAYELTDGVNAYAGYSRGFKSAGINLVAPVPLSAGVFAPQTFEPEIVDAYEVGLKTELFRNRLTLNTAVFRTTDQSYQANQSIIVDGVPKTFISNVGDVRTQGVEIDARTQPVEGLRLTAAVTYNDAWFLSYKNGQCPYLEVTSSNLAVCDLSGNQLTGVSKWVYSTSAEYGRPVGNVGSFNLLAYIGGDYNHRSAYYSTLNDDPFGRVPGYGLLNLYFGVHDDNDAWDFKVWVKNAFDKLYFNTAAVDSATTFTYSGTLGDPRFYGATLRLNFRTRHDL